MNNTPPEVLERKNCHNCKNLEFIDDCDSDGFQSASGFTCGKRLFNEYIKGTEDKFLERLNDEKYRLRGKVCFEPKSYRVEVKGE